MKNKKFLKSPKFTILICILLLSILPSITLLKAPTTLSYLADKTGTITNIISVYIINLQYQLEKSLIEWRPNDTPAPPFPPPLTP